MPSLRDLDDRRAFAARHIGPSEDELQQMLDVLGLTKVDELIDLAVPGAIRSDEPLDVPGPMTETEALAELRERASRNVVRKPLIGLGYHGTHTPGVILRNILENPAWYTAYTPYQPEISQGRLEALLNFQTMVSDLTGMDLANASLLDEGTAAAEAMTMAWRMHRGDRATLYVDADCHPQTIAVVQTRAEPVGIRVEVGDLSDTAAIGDDVFAVLIQYPGSSGAVRDHAPFAAAMAERKVAVIAAADLLALTLLTPPGEWGADIVVGTTQRFGVPLGYGGPHAGYLATREAHKRTLPGRIVGVSVDTEGRPAARLALQTREQHIRREKATSNICTSQVLLAVMAGMYGVYHGPDGLTRIAERVHRLTAVLAAGLRQGGFEVAPEAFFDTFTVSVPGRAEDVVTAADVAGFAIRRIDDDTVALALDETVTVADVNALLAVFGLEDVDLDALDHDTAAAIPSSLRRNSEFMTAAVFHDHRSETEMLRYLRRLADRDIALDRSMIPLGSCTMKLNATTEMVPVTWPEFGGLHPFQPASDAAGYLQMIGELEDWLATITGYAKVSIQPNAGSQGEFAGLLAIRGYHLSRGDDHRTVCLIPESAHGTNAASAVMAGMDVVVIKCDEDGNIDVDALRSKLDDVGDRLAALMVTYPSTHGVYESAITDICEMIHANGGQVYMDGANLNALVGVAKPGRFGSDVSHLNLHKTFCIPHGGGGPGVGPVGVAEHLVPFLPNHPLLAEAGPDTGVGPISAAPFGSAGILPISWTYVAMMGAEGLRRATEVAVLNANYLAKRLSPHYPVLYTGENGYVAHECIIDIRGIKKDTGISEDDIAKRLIDYGFHAPTMSFPVAGTLMIEPTESESKAELDRFVDAMVAIRSEIERVRSGEWAADDNPLVKAPHTAEDLIADRWARDYTREQAAFPLDSLRRDRYFPPVSRIDGAYGDRNLMCSCEPLTSYEQA